DHRGRSRRRPRPPGEVDAVVVEAQPGHRRRVPPVEVERLPARMDGAGLEVAAVANQVAADLSDAARAETLGQLAEAAERVGLAHTLAEGVGVEAVLAESRVAPPVEDQIALEHA